MYVISDANISLLNKYRPDYHGDYHPQDREQSSKVQNRDAANFSSSDSEVLPSNFNSTPRNANRSSVRRSKRLSSRLPATPIANNQDSPGGLLKYLIPSNTVNTGITLVWLIPTEIDQVIS